MPAPAHARPFWSIPLADLIGQLQSDLSGLTSAEAAARRRPDLSPGKQASRRLRILGRQLANPLLILLVLAALVALLTREWTEASFVLAIVAVTVGIGYAREYQAETAAADLRRRIRARATVVRDGRPTDIPREDLVPGDIVHLAPGDLVPADCVAIEAADLFVVQAVLTGESFPVEKAPGITPVSTPLAARSNVLYAGTSVQTGTAVALAVHTGPDTEVAGIAWHLTRPAPEHSFDRGLRRFGYFVTTAMLILVLLVFAVHVLRHRPPVETLLFSIALAVGLSPELLPAILTVNLARGAQIMARRGVLVRRLNAIENLGTMDVLCTDKTGTLTEGVVRLDQCLDVNGRPSLEVAGLARMAAELAAGRNPLDQAVLESLRDAGPPVEKLAEIPFDFTRRCTSVVVAEGDAARIITKGAAAPVMAACALAGPAPLDAAARAALEEMVAEWSRAGTRVLAIASRLLPRADRFTRADETGLTLQGFLTFLDRPKADAPQALTDLSRLNVRVALLSGDHRLVAAHVAAEVGLPSSAVLTGEDVDRLDDTALRRRVESTNVYAEMDPNQKVRVLRALKANGHVVGFLGDGINDAPAMHVADTSLSVETAVDVARDAADFVLLERDLGVIRAGIEAGRQTFANTIKYLLITMSANLGNMISMAGASLVLPFLPMTAAQILLNNLLSDLPAFGLADDHVDPEIIVRPPRWDLHFIGRFMTQFGLLSSLFDVLTFVVLLAWLHADVFVFQTAWFVESLLTELAVALVVRTARPALRSRPGKLLLWMTAGTAAVAVTVPWLPGAGWLGFTPLRAGTMAVLLAITAAYVLAVEAFKRIFYRGRVATAGT